MYMSIRYNRVLEIILLFIIVCMILTVLVNCAKRFKKPYRYTVIAKKGSKTFCIKMDTALQAQHKSCFLRPDTGPCRADILQWYFDVKQATCYQFYWGGCQGNGNRFETREECIGHCHLKRNEMKKNIPHFCSLAFDYGHCFGYFDRFAWDPLSKTCKKRMYSGCGGNQNNFQTRLECMSTCLTPPNNTLENFHTTCVPVFIADFMKK